MPSGSFAFKQGWLVLKSTRACQSIQMKNAIPFSSIAKTWSRTLSILKDPVVSGSSLIYLAKFLRSAASMVNGPLFIETI